MGNTMDTKAIESQVGAQNGDFAQFGDESLDWGAKLVDDGNDGSLFRVIPAGDYDFTVAEVKYGRTQKGANMVTVQLIIKVPGERDVHVNDRLIFTVKAQWKLVKFFKAIGLFEEAQTSGMNWNHVPDKTGRLTLKHREYNNKTYNEVADYVIPDGNMTKGVTTSGKAESAPATVQW